MMMFRIVPLLIPITGLGAIVPVSKAQSSADAGYSSTNAVSPFPSTTPTPEP